MEVQEFLKMTGSDWRKIRKDKKILQREVADAIGVSNQMISDIETDRKKYNWVKELLVVFYDL